MDKEALMMVGNNDAGSFYEMCIEFLDYLEDIINLETGVFESLGMFVSFLAFSLPLIIRSSWAASGSKSRCDLTKKGLDTR